MATKSIRDLFQLSPSEQIFDDFACTFNSMPGRIYLTQNYICFYSALLGRTTKFSVSYLDIESIVKVNSKFSKSIKIVCKAKNLKFSSFNDRDFTFKFIQRLWSSTTGQEVFSESSEDEAMRTTSQVNVERADSVASQEREEGQKQFHEIAEEEEKENAELDMVTKAELEAHVQSIPVLPNH